MAPSSGFIDKPVADGSARQQTRNDREVATLSTIGDLLEQGQYDELCEVYSRRLTAIKMGKAEEAAHIAARKDSKQLWTCWRRAGLWESAFRGRGTIARKDLAELNKAAAALDTKSN